ncbi:MAG: GNAT family N-acetyltransferase [Janthinobacterium lividum]
MPTPPTLLRPTLELPGLNARLRPWQPTDAQVLARHANDADVARYLRDVFPHPYSLADAHYYLNLVTDPASTELTVAIEVDGEAAGSISLLFQPDISRRSAEIGYWLGRQCWGQGIATAAVRALSTYGLAQFDLVRLYATVYAPNLASARVLEKAGYTLEGRLRQAVTKHEQVLDALLYAQVKPLLPLK